MNYLKLNKNQTLHFTAKEGATIDQVLDEARLLIACINSMVVVDINGFEMHIDAETDYQDLKVDYLHWMDRIANAWAEGEAAGRQLSKIGASCKDIEEFTKKLKEARESFCLPFNDRQEIKQIPPVEFGYIRSDEKSLLKFSPTSGFNLSEWGSSNVYPEMSNSKNSK